MYSVSGKKSPTVEYKSTRKLDFEALYTKMRTKENRMVSDAELRHLPDTFFYTLHRQEWKKRAEVVYKFLDYIKRPEGKFKVMDLGCGGGWLGGRIAQMPQFEVVGVDIHGGLLERGAKVFAEEDIRFVCGDIFEDIAELNSFDVIVVCDALMYFPKLEKLINRCRQYLKPGGELHLIENTFYTEKEREIAIQKKQTHLQDIGCEEMMEYLTFHSETDLHIYDYNYLYKPSGFLRMFSDKKSPYPWIRILN